MVDQDRRMETIMKEAKTILSKGLLAVLGSGGAFVYIKFIKPKQSAKVSAEPDDYAFEDEEECINEDYPEPEETEETK